MDETAVGRSALLSLGSRGSGKGALEGDVHDGCRLPKTSVERTTAPKVMDE